MSFGALSKAMIVALPDLLDTLKKNCISQGRESDEAESRKFAVISLMQIVRTAGISHFTGEQLQSVFDTLFLGLKDYAVDRRGDVGSWVREQCMPAIKDLTCLILYEGSEEQKKLLSPEHYVRFINALMQQLMEKIDKIREVAGRTLQ